MKYLRVGFIIAQRKVKATKLFLWYMYVQNLTFRESFSVLFIKKITVQLLQYIITAQQQNSVVVENVLNLACSDKTYSFFSLFIFFKIYQL